MLSSRLAFVMLTAVLASPLLGFSGGGPVAGAAPLPQVADQTDLFLVRVIPNKDDARRPAFDAAYNQGYEQFTTVGGMVDGWLAQATQMSNPVSPSWSDLRTAQPRIYVGLTMNRLIESMAGRQAEQVASGGALMTWPEEDLYVEDTYTDVNRLLPTGEGISSAEVQPLATCLERFSSFKVSGLPLVGTTAWIEGLSFPGRPGFWLNMDRDYSRAAPHQATPIPASGEVADPDGYWERGLELAFQKNTFWLNAPTPTGAVTVDYNPCVVSSRPEVLDGLFVQPPPGNFIIGQRREPWSIGSGLLQAYVMALGSVSLQGASVTARLSGGIRRDDPIGDRTVRFGLNDPRGQVVKVSPSIHLLTKANAALKWMSGGKYIAPITERYWGVLERKLRATGAGNDAEVTGLLSRLRSRHEFLSSLAVRSTPPTYWTLDCAADLGPFGHPDCSTEDYKRLVSFRHRSFNAYSGDFSIFATALRKDVERLLRQATGVAVFRGYWPDNLYQVYQEPMHPSQSAILEGELDSAIRDVLNRNPIPCLHQRLLELVITDPPAPAQPCQVSTITPRLDSGEIGTAASWLKLRFSVLTAAAFLGPMDTLGSVPPARGLFVPHPKEEEWVAVGSGQPVWGDGSDAVASQFAPVGVACKDASGAVLMEVDRTHRALPMAGGRVVKVGQTWVAIDHGDGVVGFYQYLGGIQVREGQSSLSADTTLGYPSLLGGAGPEINPYCRIHVALASYTVPPVVGQWSPDNATWLSFPASLEAR